MSRRRASAILVVFVLAAIAVSASDFWVSKDWKQWSKDDCEKLLSESPWAHTWRRGEVPGEDLFVFSLQLRSALPIRQANVRQLQFKQNYDKLSDAQRADFDKQVDETLNRSYDDTIHVHVHVKLYEGKFDAVLLGDLRSFPKKLETMDVTLITSDRSRIKATRVELSQGEDGFDAYFPRTSNGGPVLKEGQRYFSVQFTCPALLGVGLMAYPPQVVGVKFEPAKMVLAGKFLY
jgi:hypothetical protein